MQIKRKATVILRSVALVAAVMYFLLPATGYENLFLSVMWFCIGVDFSKMLPIWEKSAEIEPDTRVRGSPLTPKTKR